MRLSPRAGEVPGGLDKTTLKPAWSGCSWSHSLYVFYEAPERESSSWSCTPPPTGVTEAQAENLPGVRFGLWQRYDFALNHFLYFI